MTEEHKKKLQEGRKKALEAKKKANIDNVSTEGKTEQSSPKETLKTMGLTQQQIEILLEHRDL